MVSIFLSTHDFQTMKKGVHLPVDLKVFLPVNLAAPVVLPVNLPAPAPMFSSVNLPVPIVSPVNEAASR